MLGLASIALFSRGAEAQVAEPMPVPDLTQPELAPEKQSVLQRAPPPGYETLDVRLGSFILDGSLDLDETFDSNIFATASNARSDFITDIAPRVAIQSDWSNHAVALVAQSTISRHAQNPAEDVEDAAVEAEGRLDIATGEYLQLAGGYQTLHEDRSSPDDNLGRFPTAYSLASGRLSYVRSQSRIGFGFDADISRYDYSNEPTAGGGEIVNKDRNRLEASLTPRVGYEVLPGYQAYVEATGDTRIYDQKFDRNGLQRNSSGFSVATGIESGVGHIITGRIYIGYQQQYYDDPSLATFRAPYFGASVLWNVTQLTSLRFGLSDSIAETILPGASGAQQTLVSASVEHELERTLLLTGGVGYERDAYQGNQRTDGIYSANASVERLLNRVLSVKLVGGWQQRSSTVSGAGYDRETMMLVLKIRL
jgi:hypothetical protein